MVLGIVSERQRSPFVHCEVESEGSRKQILALTNINIIIRPYKKDESAKQDEVQYYSNFMRTNNQVMIILLLDYLK